MKREPSSTIDISFALWSNSRAHRCLFQTVWSLRHSATSITGRTGSNSPIARHRTIPREDDGSDCDAENGLNQREREARPRRPLGHGACFLFPFPNQGHPQILLGKKDVSWRRQWLLWSQAALDAQMLAKMFDDLSRRLGPDVREGKRTSGPPGYSKLRALSVSEVWFGEDDDEGEEDFEQEQEEECREYSSIASRWFDGLISKGIQMANEVFSIHTIDFDRQELRKLVWRVQSTQEQPAKNKREASIALLRAQKSSTCFLRSLARQLCCSNT
ncbi:hypothetical protein ACJRO7_022793 [Eucalyptus globulus]|uniref:Uncharacterized protein n=1 Tax=Eucalyptus globulus TaxID=34317 RepID=A0ABD3KCK6_EUCGL